MVTPFISQSQIRNNENAIIMISGGKTEDLAQPVSHDGVANSNGSFVVQGFIVGEFSISGGNEFNSLFELSAQQKLQSIGQQLGAALSEVGNQAIKDFGKQLADIRLVNVANTIQNWMGSTHPSFIVPMIFVAIDEEDDIRKPVRQLLTTVYPKIDGLGIIKPPHDYSIVNDSASGGTIAVSIGNWFRAGGQVMKSVNFTFSKEVVANGTPLYASGTVEFMPHKMISADEMGSYIDTSVLPESTENS